MGDPAAEEKRDKHGGEADDADGARGDKEKKKETRGGITLQLGRL